MLRGNRDKTGFLAPGSAEHGWLAAREPLPKGYLNDPGRSASTFVEVAGERVALTGDRAVLRDDGRIGLLGRDSMTVNTGGEKVFVEEVEQVVRAHPSVVDALVVGRPHERWAEEIVAVVQLSEPVTRDELLTGIDERLARYKLPKAFVVVAAIRRSPAGKPDYGWAKSIVKEPEVLI